MSLVTWCYNTSWIQLIKNVQLSVNEPSSPFRKVAVDKFPMFQWKSLIEHLLSTAPTLFRLLSTISSHSDHRNKKKVDSAHYPGICMTAAVLLKERNREMCGVDAWR